MRHARQSFDEGAQSTWSVCSVESASHVFLDAKPSKGVPVQWYGSTNEDVEEYVPKVECRDRDVWRNDGLEKLAALTIEFARRALVDIYISGRGIAEFESDEVRKQCSGWRTFSDEGSDDIVYEFVEAEAFHERR